MSSLKKKHFSQTVTDTLPVLAGYLFLGGGFGILLVENGYTALWAGGMALTIFAGSGQYLAVSLLAGGAGLVTAAVATFLVNARHIFYGISLLDVYKNAPGKAYMIFGLTDETYTLVTMKQPPQGLSRHTYCLWVTLLNHIYWICGCVLGAIAGTVLPVNFQGVEFVLTALFVTMFVEQWTSVKHHLPALIGVGATVLCLALFGKEIFLIPSMALIALLLIVADKTARRQTNA